MTCAYFGAKILRGEQWPPKESYNMPEDEKLEDAFDLSQEECEKRVPASHGDYLSLYTSHCMEYLRTLANVYLQADRLQDFATANLVIDEIIDTQERTNHSSPNDVINTVYESTVHGSPLRKLMRDVGLHGGWSAFYLDPHSFKFHEDYARDIFVEFMRVKTAASRNLCKMFTGYLLRARERLTGVSTTSMAFIIRLVCQILNFSMREIPNLRPTMNRSPIERKCSECLSSTSPLLDVRMMVLMVVACRLQCSVDRSADLVNPSPAIDGR
jgi:hypothetical protein